MGNQGTALKPPTKYRPGTEDRPIELELDKLEPLGMAVITSLGSENLYVEKEGLHYWCKVGYTERFAEGIWDFAAYPEGADDPEKTHSKWSDSRAAFSDRVRFNWGFHDGTADAERADARDMAEHYDKAYANGYVRGVLAWKNLGLRPESSDDAWNAMQATP